MTRTCLRFLFFLIMPAIPGFDYGNVTPIKPETWVPRIGSAAVALGTAAALYDTTQDLRTRWHTGSSFPFNSRTSAFLAAAPYVAKWGAHLKKTWGNARQALGYSYYPSTFSRTSSRSSYTRRRSDPPGMAYWPTTQWVRRSRNAYRPSSRYRYRRRRYY